MRILFTVVAIMVLLAIVKIGVGLEAYSLSQQSENVYPHILEYINNFTINTNDLEKTLNEQLHSIKLGEVKTSYAHIINSTVSLSHYGSERRIENLSPLKVKVINDTFTTFVMFSVHVLHIVGGKNYTCNVSLPLVYVSYFKEIDLQTGNIMITGLNSTYASKLFNKAVCKEPESAKDQTRIDEVVNSTEGSSIYIELKKSFDRLPQYFTANAKGEHLSKIYQTNPYEYDYYGYKININVSTIQATKFGENGVENMISGNIAGTPKAAVAPPDYEPGYSSFISIEFIQNMIAYSKDNYPTWKNVKLNRQNMRTNIFKYRLIDFEPIIPSVLSKYPQNYLSDVEIQCSIESVKELVINEKNATQNIDWRCTGSFEVKPTIRQTFLNFLVDVKHTLDIRADETRLIVYVNKIQIINVNFDIIGSYDIVDPYSFIVYANEGLFQFRVFTIGTFFKISSPNQLLKLSPGKGLWVG